MPGQLLERVPQGGRKPLPQNVESPSAVEFHDEVRSAPRDAAGRTDRLATLRDADHRAEGTGEVEPGDRPGGDVSPVELEGPAGARVTGGSCADSLRVGDEAAQLPQDKVGSQG